MKINTVNVIVTKNSVVDSVRSFRDDTKGNKQAEEFFTKQVKKIGTDTDMSDIEIFLEDGSYTSGEHTVFLAHSS